MGYGPTYSTYNITATGTTGYSAAKDPSQGSATLTISGTYATVAFTVEATCGGGDWFPIACVDASTNLPIAGSTTISPSDNAEYAWIIPSAANYTAIRTNVSSYGSGTAVIRLFATNAFIQPNVTVSSSTGSFTNVTASGTLGVTGATTLSSTLAVTGNVAVNTNKFNVTAASGNTAAAGSILSSSASGGIGYATGAGGAVTQASSRTTGVTVNTPVGAITLVSAAGSTTPATFTVTNSSVAATDVILLSQKSGTDLYTLSVSRVAAGAFDITFNTKSGTTTEQPVFNFAVVKGVAA